MPELKETTESCEEKKKQRDRFIQCYLYLDNMSQPRDVITAVVTSPLLQHATILIVYFHDLSVEAVRANMGIFNNWLEQPLRECTDGSVSAERLLFLNATIGWRNNAYGIETLLYAFITVK